MNNREIFDKVMLGNDFMQDLMMNYEWLNRAVTNPLRTDKTILSHTISIRRKMIIFYFIIS